MTVKAIVMDIDGTLTNDKKVITPRTLEALMAAQAKGIKVILASGRPVQGLKAIGAQLKLAHYGGIYVAFGGAHVESAKTAECYFNQVIPEPELRLLIEHVAQFDVIAWLNEGRTLYVTDAYRCMISNDKGGTTNIVKYERDACDLRICEVDSLMERAGSPQNKLLCAGDPEYLKQHYAEMRAPFEGTLSAGFTEPWYFEFMPLGVDKANALDKTLAKLDIAPSEVIAFGDGQNDVTMLSWAGLGVAMGNAVEAAKAAADMVTADNNHDGIAEALEKLL